ncbi:hypothetical protein OCGS_2747 [Oceaniovalibus guishaninsula JLT2003]|uniref:Uncharacterized protein n=1 Tax=Oceaniovalibus guishaninsula JLT2003 TaxID=1231392 RepID=K2GKB1_9RHOB|nr:tetratricopeptide repeat protein [Oceaniovalibus guishaninsula]EKE43156.1 hypothetical protein OCGS_2747 [Oceaniovalibus guishaninsula JLT2003]
MHILVPAAIFAALVWATATGAQPATGNAAFAEADYDTAFALWQTEALKGSSEAAFGLGLLHDLGLGRRRDPVQALQWYRLAAVRGLADAQFNVAVMLDSGGVGPPDPQLAALWYARAAASGHVRAQYNLGLLYEQGSGVPRNADLARHWFDRAASAIPQAAAKLTALTNAVKGRGVLDAPLMPTGVLIRKDDTVFAELVWTARPGPDATSYLVELADGGDIIASKTTAGSAAILPVAVRQGNLRWRVTALGADGNEAPAPWQPLIEAAPVRIVVGTQDKDADMLAADLAAALDRAGIAAVTEKTDRDADRSSIVHGPDDDAAGLAQAIAAYLPPGVSSTTGAVVADWIVTVRLVGGPIPTR